MLKGIAGMSEDDIVAKRGIGYARASATRSRCSRTAPTTSPSSCARSRSTRSAICESGENMPPKSTYFFPKLLTGLVFNPLG